VYFRVYNYFKYKNKEVNEMKIKEAAEMFELTIDTLRYYERIEIIPPIKRDSSGYRE
jgi:hypothetical protein